MNLFNLDLHISVIEDIGRILGDLGHRVTSVNMSGHNWVFGRKQQSTDVVTAGNWHLISPAMCDAFHARYRDELAGYDAFLTTHVPCLSWLFRDFKQPVYVVCSTRYEAPFHRNPALWSGFNRYLADGCDSSRIRLLANNRYDARYAEHFLGRPVRHVPSLCQYVEASYAPTDRRFLLYGVDALPGVPAASALQGFLVPKGRALPPGHRWRDACRFRGVVALPYNVSTMSFFEYYAMGIPLFVPTPRFMLELKGRHPGQVLNQVSWNQVAPAAMPGLDPRSLLKGAGGWPDPNDHLSPRWADWLALADFYDPEWMPHITYFDSWTDLGKRLGGATDADLAAVSRRMMDHNRVRRDLVYATWRELTDAPVARAPSQAV